MSGTETGSGAASGTESGVGCCGTADSKRAEAEALRRIGITRPPGELPARGTSGALRVDEGSGPAASTSDDRTDESRPGVRSDAPWNGPSGDQPG
ncbi:hypothetical protein KBX06_13105 [Micromonospora sp. C31]|uniref:hypothetical protein n=1 Tax=Micromonospora sp. C31 TaxID=2824876 RepID=UPI001B37263C|nr:hypothetical protein [Micromonospora sp. C31]MBQ1074092.1 hypothetical protein [Micromonospora sp. C31]